MKHLKPAVAFAVIACLSVRAAELPASKPVDSRIARVTVYSDRARVTRTADLGVQSGRTVYSFAKLPGWLDEESIRMALTPQTAARITDVQVKRDYLSRADNEELRKTEAAVQEITDKLASLTDEGAVLDAQTRHIDAIRVFSLEKLPMDAALRDVSVESYGKVVGFITDSLRLTAAAKRDIEQKRRELQPELNARRKMLNELRNMTQLEETTVLVTIDADAAGKATLDLTYMLPGATWEPAHELRAAGVEPKSVELASYAEVTQTTGEDWSGADISFSTQSPTETIRIPELDALLLGTTPNVARIVGAQTSSFVKAQQTYQGQNRMWFNYFNPDGNMQVFDNNWNMQEVKVANSSRVFRQIQKRGTTAHFRAGGMPTIRSDGRSVRVPIGRVQLAAQSRIVAAPQMSLNAARTVEMTNTGKQPLLPGRVALYHDGAFLGLTDIDFIAEGEALTLFLGVADQIKLSRVLDRKRSSIARGRRTRMHAVFKITVENLSNQKVSLCLTDRIPVSENKEIEVERVRIEPEVVPDSRGILRWDVALDPKQERLFSIQYRVEYPPEAIQTLNKGAASPVAEDLSIQLKQVEDQF